MQGPTVPVQGESRPPFDAETREHICKENRHGGIRIFHGFSHTSWETLKNISQLKAQLLKALRMPLQ